MILPGNGSKTKNLDCGSFKFLGLSMIGVIWLEMVP